MLSTKIKLIFAAVVCLAPLFIAEIGLRLAGVRFAAETDELANQLAVSAKNSDTIFLPGSGLFWGPRPGTVIAGQYVINQDGFRGMSTADRLPQGPPPAGRRRILCFGDSAAFGWSIPDTADTWPAQLQQMLGDGYEVLNLARPGYTSFQGKILAAQFAGKLGCAMAIVAFGLNDCGESPLPDSARHFHFSHNEVVARLAPYAFRLRTLALARRLVLSRPAAERRRVPLREFRENLVAIARQCPQSLFLTEPVSRCIEKECYEKTYAEAHPPYNAAIRELGARGALHVLDVDRIFADCGDSCTVGCFPFVMKDGVIVGGDPIHPNERGARLIAGLVGQAVKGEFGP